MSIEEYEVTEHLNVKFAGLKITGHSFSSGGRKVVNLDIGILGEDSAGSAPSAGEAPPPASPPADGDTENKLEGSGKNSGTDSGHNMASEEYQDFGKNSGTSCEQGVKEEIPAHVLDGARRLRKLGQFSAEQRIRRAFEAGLQAKRVLSGERRCPEPTPKFDTKVNNTVWVVLPEDASEEPYYAEAWAVAKAAMGGSLDNAKACVHAWPSHAEAAAYCVGAGLPGLPSLRTNSGLAYAGQNN